MAGGYRRGVQGKASPLVLRAAAPLPEPQRTPAGRLEPASRKLTPCKRPSLCAENGHSERILLAREDQPFIGFRKPRAYGLQCGERGIRQGLGTFVSVEKAHYAPLECNGQDGDLLRIFAPEHPEDARADSVLRCQPAHGLVTRDDLRERALHVRGEEELLAAVCDSLPADTLDHATMDSQHSRH